MRFVFAFVGEQKAGESAAERFMNACLFKEGATSIAAVGKTGWKVDFPNRQRFTWQLIGAPKSGKAPEGVAAKAWSTCGRKFVHMKSSGVPFGTTPS